MVPVIESMNQDLGNGFDMLLRTKYWILLQQTVEERFFRSQKESAPLETIAFIPKIECNYEASKKDIEKRNALARCLDASHVPVVDEKLMESWALNKKSMAVGVQGFLPTDPPQYFVEAEYWKIVENLVNELEGTAQNSARTAKDGALFQRDPDEQKQHESRKASSAGNVPTCPSQDKGEMVFGIESLLNATAFDESAGMIGGACDEFGSSRSILEETFTNANGIYERYLLWNNPEPRIAMVPLRGSTSPAKRNLEGIAIKDK